MGNFSASPQLPPWTSTQAQSAFSSSTMLQMHGDVQDRFRLHTTPAPFRRWLSSGFPCQPLSTQGDMKGQLDPRSDVFYGTLRAAWEQQAGGLLLECVSGAGTARLEFGVVDLPDHLTPTPFMAMQEIQVGLFWLHGRMCLCKFQTCPIFRRCTMWLLFFRNGQFGHHRRKGS